MDTKKIEVLLRALELGSLSKAAQEYLYTPSAVSHILDTLEDELGTKIVRRTYRGIEPEEGCEEIISGLKEILEAEKRVIRLSATRRRENPPSRWAPTPVYRNTSFRGLPKASKRSFPTLRSILLWVTK